MSGRYPGGGRRSPVTATALLTVTLALLPFAAFSGAPIAIINEIMWDAAEYVELKNTTDEPISLAGWQLTRQQSGGEAKVIVTFDEEDVIPAQGYFVIEKNEGATSNNADKIVAALTLNNTTGELVQLLDPAGTVIDSANQLGKWFAGANTTEGVAMERTTAEDGTAADNWHTSTAIVADRHGTPGTANSEPAVNEPPSAVIDGPSTAATKETLSYTAEDSFDPENNSLTFTWDFGDGTTATGISPTHSYQAAGSYTVLLTASDGEHEAEATQSITVTVPHYSTKIVINEFLPNPAGSDTAGEFIELRNLDSVSVDLTGWQLDDGEGGSAPFTFPAGTSLAGSSIRVWYRSETKLALNNDEDTVRLIDPVGAIKAAIPYADLAEGVSYNLPPAATAATASAYVASSTPTANSTNIITALTNDDDGEDEDEDKSDDSAKTATGRVAGTSAVTVPLKDVRDEEVGTTITTEGVVSAPPGILGKKVLYVAGSGIQVYLGGGELPDVKLGDTVSITGELSSNRGEARLKIASAAGVTKKTSAAPPVPHQVATGDIDESWEGSLVIVQGTVTETSGDTFFIDDDSGEIKVAILASTNIDKPKMKKGTAVTITGVVSETTTGYRILPRFQEDVRLGLVAGLTSFPATGRSTIGLLAAIGLAGILLTAARRHREPLLMPGK